MDGILTGRFTLAGFTPGCSGFLLHQLDPLPGARSVREQHGPGIGIISVTL